MAKELSEGYRDITIPGFGDFFGPCIDVHPKTRYNDEQPSLIEQANELLDRIEANLHYIVESIKAKKQGEVGL